MPPLRFIVLSLVLSLAAAHTFLTDPDAYYRRFQIKNCRGSECQQACPTFPKNPRKMRNTRSRPARRWSRGQSVTIRWARNNHNNGFVRFTIVPVNVMMSRRWHSRLAFYTGCHAQSRFRCSGERGCGADKTRTAYSRRITVPTIYPDGDYVLGMVWFGGARPPINRRPKFSDFWSCSYIRIQGGPLKGSVQPSFDTGKVEPVRGLVRGKCLSAIDAPGACSKFGCRGRAEWILPRGFKRGQKKPPRVAVGDVVEARRA